MPWVFWALNKASYSHSPLGNMTHALNMLLVSIILLYSMQA